MSTLPSPDAADNPVSGAKAHRSAVERTQQRLESLRVALAQAENNFRKASARQEAIRERAVGRAVWSLIKDNRLDPKAIALIRDKLHDHPSRCVATALVDTAFEKYDCP